MDVKVENGDMVFECCGNPKYIDGMDEIAQRVKIACSIKKGKFAQDIALGSYAYTIDKNSDMLCEKLAMIFKEATISIGYDDLRVTQVDTTQSPVVAKVEIICEGETVHTEVSIDV